MSTAKPYDDITDRVQQAFQEQIAFFRGKLGLPTRTWRDIERHAHDRAFVVAGVMNFDLLGELRGAVGKAIADGESLDKFRERFFEAVDKHGWKGWTGSGSREGRAWRTRTIYQTNMATSYAAGRWRQLVDLAENGGRPYWRYVHSGASEPRPQHKMWGDMRLTLRYDDPFWQTHYPPNGWGCGCSVRAVEAPAEGDATEPPSWWQNKDPKTGAPIGLDEKWDYAPGSLGTDVGLRELVRDRLHNKLFNTELSIGSALAAELQMKTKTGHKLNVFADVMTFCEEAMQGKHQTEELWVGFVDTASATINKAFDAEPASNGERVNAANYLVLLPGGNIRHSYKKHGGDRTRQRAPTAQDYARALEVLEDPKSGISRAGGDSIMVESDYDDETKEHLVFIFSVHNSGNRRGALLMQTLYIWGKEKAAEEVARRGKRK